MNWLTDLQAIKHNPLWLFSGLCLLGTLACFIMMKDSPSTILGVNAWLKPLKFFLSVGIFSATMAFYLRFLHFPHQVTIYGWAMSALLSYELICIALQASSGRRSYFNTETGLDSFVAITMGVAILLAMLHTCLMVYLFFIQQDFNLPEHLVLAIRPAIVGMVVFACEGMVMVSHLKHTIGAEDGLKGIEFLNWSKDHGDLRIAHFFGMHALQLIPLCAWGFALNKATVWLISIAYFTFVTFTLIQALNARPFIR